MLAKYGMTTSTALKPLSTGLIRASAGLNLCHENADELLIKDQKLISYKSTLSTSSKKKAALTENNSTSCGITTTLFCMASDYQSGHPHHLIESTSYS